MHAFVKRTGIAGDGNDLFNRGKKQQVLKRVSHLWETSTRKPESHATQVLQQVTIENKKGTDKQYFQNSRRKQSERKFRKIKEEFDPVTLKDFWW